MYSIDHSQMPHAVGIRVSGGIEEADFVALRDEMASILDKTAPLNVVFQCDPDVEIRPGVLWDDLNFMQSRAGQLGRLAMIASDDWKPMVEIAQDSGFESQFFPYSDEAAAWQWAKGA